MDEMMNYIFGSIRTSEVAVKNISKALTKQTKINKSFRLFAICVTVNLVISEIERREQSEKIRKMEKEIEELKRSEGE